MTHAERALVTLMAAAFAGCSFEPHIPSGSILCIADSECPPGYRCQQVAPRRTVCCAPGACDGHDSDGGPVDAAVISASDGRDARADMPPPDAERVVPPRPPPPPPSPPTVADAGGAPEVGADVASLVTCSSSFNVPPPTTAPRDVLCTVTADDDSLTVWIDDITNHDPVSIRAEGMCWINERFGGETLDAATGAPRPLPAASADLLVAAVGQFKKVCDAHGGRLVGVRAAAWARRATNAAAVGAQLKGRTALALDVPSVDDELAQAYLGVTRNRRRWLVVDQRVQQPQLVAWLAGASAPVTFPVPVTSADAERIYFANPMYQLFDDARVALRGQMKAALAPTLTELRTLIGNGQLESAVAVGPATAMIPLAVGGALRAGGAWNDVATVNAKLAAATVAPTPDPAVTTTPFGRIFGLVLPADLDLFFPSLDATQFTQLRSAPRDAAYGRELMFATTLFDILGDETKATEFGFVFAFPHFGYLFSKLYPMAPS